MKILITDDHALIREALRGVLVELAGEVTVREAVNGSATLRALEESPDLDLVLLDLNLPDRDGFSVLAELRSRYPAVPVVVLSGLKDRESVSKALALGALGFIPKSTEREVMLRALQLVFSGGIYIPPEILGREASVPSPPQRQLPAERARALGLSERQMEVLALMMEGKSNKAICRLLHLAEPTVKNHVTAILKALKASNRTEAVIVAARLREEPRS